ncbi:ROK family transcriptional regulator [Loktanella sp. TSTF-M6]|uniref:ROK family transcriptional regulator n=1 Tax=Loktanella gaetbuli TaxID=2881335 RepID=A0ABS8BYI7_9RHOB|nr:ROK family transcriptional regulator [Loktanella gaetbuli]MCB5200797.1 ROK family transcriptional regulator [Loktanella gaetbuli]
MTHEDSRVQTTGRNQSALRDHNERLILTKLSRQGPMPGSEISRVTALSPQTVSVILRELEQDGMLTRGTPMRGRVGKPSIPMELSKNGAYSIGVKIGRRSATVVLTNILGEVLLNRSVRYDYPIPGPIMKFLNEALTQIRTQLGSRDWDRIAGIGIAKPYEIWAWHDTIGAPQRDLDLWRDFDFADSLGQICDLDVFVENDATAASQAEHLYGAGRAWSHYAYFFVGTFIGGGVVLNDAVFEGPFVNAGAFGSLPVRTATGETRQLIDTASLYLLEDRIRATGSDPSAIWQDQSDWSQFGPIIEDWIAQTGTQLAFAALSVCSVIDFEAIVIDGSMPGRVREGLVARARQELETLDTRGLHVPQVVAGAIGPQAREMGAAAIPIHAKHFLALHAGDVA